MAEGQGRTKRIWQATYAGNADAASKSAVSFEATLDDDPERRIVVRVPASRIASLISSLTRAEARMIGLRLKSTPGSASEDAEKYGAA